MWTEEQGNQHLFNKGCTARKEVLTLDLEIKHHFPFYTTELTAKTSSIIGKMKQPQSKSKYYDLNHNISITFHFHLSSISVFNKFTLLSKANVISSLHTTEIENIERGRKKKLTHAHSFRSHGRGRRGKNLTPSLF